MLGVANVHPVDLANAYATLAAGGQRTPWHVVAEVLGPDGEVRYTAAPEPEQVIPADVVSDVSFALQAVVEDGSGFAAQELGRPSAGKTGTTNDNKSSWYAGYVPQLAGGGRALGGGRGRQPGRVRRAARRSPVARSRPACGPRSCRARWRAPRSPSSLSPRT